MLTTVRCKCERFQVLIVEDQKEAAEVLECMLKSLGNTVLASLSSGIEAIRFVRTNTPDVVIMDLNMPDMDGISATRAILRERNIPLVFCSGLCNASTMESARQLGVQGYLVKPFTRNQLFTTLTLAFAHHRKVRDVMSQANSLEVELVEFKAIASTVGMMADRYQITRDEAHDRLEKIAARRGWKESEAAEAVIRAFQSPTVLPV